MTRRERIDHARRAATQEYARRGIHDLLEIGVALKLTGDRETAAAIREIVFAELREIEDRYAVSVLSAGGSALTGFIPGARS